MTDAVADMLSGAPPGDGGPAPAPESDAKVKDDPVYQMLSGAAAGPAPPDQAGPAAAAPAAPAGPSRPRAVSRLPAQAPKPPGAPPGGIVNATEDLSPQAVWSGALQNAAGSFGNQVSQTLKPFLDWKGDAQLAHQLFTNPGGVAKAVGQVYGPRYDLLHPTREGGILQTLKHDPFAPLSDAAAVASVLSGGELLAPKLAGTAGDVASIVGKVGKAGQYLDPAYAAAKAAGVPVKLALKTPGIGRATGSALGRGLGVAGGLAVPAPGAHLVTGMAGEHIGGELGGALGESMATIAAHPGVRQVVRTAEGAIPAATAAAGMLPMSPEEQAQTPGGQGAGAAPPGGGGGGGPALDPRYAGDPVYQMLMGGPPMGGSPGPVAGEPSGGGSPGNPVDVIRQAEGGFNQPVGYAPKGTSARGAFQMIDPTYRRNLRKYHPEIAAGMTDGQIDAFRNSEAGWGLNESMGRQMAQDELGQLQHEGLAPSAENLGALHMLGNTRLLHASPDTPIEQVTGADQRAANAGVFRNIRTAGDYLAWMRRRNQTAAAQLGKADGGRVGLADGGEANDADEVGQHLKRLGYWRDNPGGDWLQRKQQYADEDAAQRGGPSSEGLTAKALSGASTAGVQEYPMLPVSELAKLPGVNNEQRYRHPGEPKYDRLMRTVREAGGFDPVNHPVFVNINHRGEAYLNEGNHRTAVAHALGVPHLKTEVRWFNGGEDAPGPWSPENVARMSMRRQERAAGGQVVDLTEKLLARAGQAQKAAQSATKPLLGLSDDHVAQALKVAQRGI